MREQAPTKAVLRYYGGKWRIADWIISHFPPHETYVEPFCGSASVLMRKPRSRNEVINDLSGDVVNLFRVIRDRPLEFARAVYWTPYSRAELDECARTLDDTTDDLERARKFYVLCWQSRALQHHRHTSGRNWRLTVTSWSSNATVWADLPKQILAAARRLRGVYIEQRDAIEVIRTYDRPGTLYYVDPPYPRITGRDDYVCDIPDEYHARLADVLRSIRGMAVVSSIRNPLYDRLFHGWQVSERSHRTMGNTERVEALYISPRTADRLQRSRMRTLL